MVTDTIFQVLPTFLFLAALFLPNTGLGHRSPMAGAGDGDLSGEKMAGDILDTFPPSVNYSNLAGSRTNYSDYLVSAVTDPSPPLSLPHIDPYHSTNMTALAGATTRLNCRVYRLGNKTVSWMLKDKLHLLTVGRYTYTSDLRYEASHAQHSADWGLVLRSAARADSGQYQCQVSTTPIITHDVWLTVKEPRTEILGAPHMYVSVDSTINITCLISNVATPPAEVTWHHNSSLISYSGPRPGVSMITDKSPSSVRVTLILSEAAAADSGTYSCLPRANSSLAALPGAEVAVVVLEQSQDHTAMLSPAPHTPGPGLTPLMALLLQGLVLVCSYKY